MRTKVLCHGCFDVLHAGHLKHFQAAKKYGNYLIVSITSDRFVNKGPGRPYFPAQKRAEMVAALSLVDEVFTSDEPTAIGAIRRFQPDFYVKGSDYKNPDRDVTGEILNEKREVESYGGKLVFTDEETHSSSTIINRFFQGWSEDQKAQIEKINSLGGISSIESALEQVKKLKVLVVGEPIVDIYRFVNPEGISSKSPTISARFQYEEEYQGGADAIFNHLGDFCEPMLLWALNKKMNARNKIKKIRYIEPIRSQRVFEVTEINENDWTWDGNAEALRSYAKKVDVVVAADFGHGLFEGPVIEALKEIKCFVGLNVQANSSNFGFNVYGKHEKYDYLCLDKREAQLALNDRLSTREKLLWSTRQKIGNTLLSMTLGKDGAFFLENDHQFYSPAFADTVTDATGAGDCYFAITTVLLASGCRPELIPFIGNVAAGLKCKIIGNKSSITKASLLKACAGILK